MASIAVGARAACSRVATSAVLHPTVSLSRGAVVHEGAVLGEGVVIGRDTVVGAATSLFNCTIGARCVIHPGVRIGQDGFGFDLSTAEDGVGHAKKEQTLGVEVGDDVEIGANTCIDRGSWRDTKIGCGSKLDNLVQVGHNVNVGKHCVVASLCGLGGSVTLGNRVFIGAMTGILQHTTIGENVKIAARSGVTKDIPAGQVFGGHPAVPIRDYHRQTVARRRAATKLKQVTSRT